MEDKLTRTNLLLNHLRRGFEEASIAECFDIALENYSNILVISPHSDDEVIGCGGIISHFAKSNCEVTVLIVTEEGSRSISKSSKSNPGLRVDECKKVKEKLAYHSLYNLGFKELELQRDPNSQKELRKTILNLLENINPQALFIPNGMDVHPDHRTINTIVNDILKEKLEPGYINNLEHIFTYEVWSPVKMNYFFCLNDNNIKLKKECLSQYQTQLETVDYLSIIDFINKLRAEQLKAEGFVPQIIEYAEAYSLAERKSYYRATHLNNAN